MVARVMSKFLQRKQGKRATDFCEENFLTYNSMNMLQDLKS